ncbi:MAG: SdrD B-like domain-containing protein [Ferruginibacter sp.]
MKRILIFFIAYFVANSSIKAQYVTIPDDNLRFQLKLLYPSCFNVSDMMDTTCAAIVNETTLYISDNTIITNWDGYQYFKNLQKASFNGALNAADEQTLPNLPATLKELNVSSMPTLTYIPILPPSLERLIFNYHAGGALQQSVLPASLRYISITDQSGITFPAGLPNSLDTLIITMTGYTYLPALPASLRYLECDNNYLISLPDLPASLKYLSCSNNSDLSTLPVLPASLETLNARLNSLTTIPNFPNSLKTVDVGGNLLTSLPQLPASLTSLDCSFNPYLYCLPAVPSGTNGLVITVNENTTCIPNHPSPSYTVQVPFTGGPGVVYFGYNSDAFLVCNSVNNVNGCQAFPVMTGHVYNDYNNNGLKDANEPYRANVKVTLSNGVFTMTNSNGYYEIASDNIGSYTLAVTPPNYFTSVPLQYNYNFNSFDTVVTKDFPLQATAVADDISISVLPVNAAARPGFSYPYVISYTNIGTTTLTPNIVFNYDNTRLTYNSSSNASVINNGSSLTLAETTMPQGVQKSFTGYFTVKPAAVIGDSIKAYVSIHANAVTATDSTAVRIKGSYDPNDKSATPALSTVQVANGDYIYYTVRFQNTGTAAAVNVVITDSLTGQLQPATLQVINTSHPARVTVNADKVYCEFLNINLPDSNVNQLASHGFITFRIKPKLNTTVGNVIPNKAAIYFDYNTPIITAEAQTLIYDAAPGSHTYTFNGTGNWTTAANWVGGVVPPSTLQSGDHIIINGSCILNVVVTANSGSSIVVATGKSFFVQGNLIIQ